MARRSAQATLRGGNAGTRQIPWWIWFLAGLFCGLGLSALVLMKQWAPQLAARGDSIVPPVAPAAEPSATEERPKYDFYSVLPEMEVVVPDAEVKSAAATPQAPSAQAGSTRFMLQAASFRTAGDADALKARLTMLNVGPISVQAVTINGAEYFRVRVGPFADLRAVDAAKSSLESNGISAIALRESATP